MINSRAVLRSYRSWLSAALLLAAYLPRHPLASSGDRAWAFQACLQNCQVTGCTYLIHTSASQQPNRTCTVTCHNADRTGTDAAHRTLISSTSHREDGVKGAVGSTEAAAPPIPLPLLIFRWNCQDDCKYLCMRAVETQKAASGGETAPVDKYYGKWPFIRVLGMQELASVLASLANLAAHALCLHRLRSVALSSAVAATHHSTSPIGSTHSSTPGYASPSTGSLKLPARYPFLWLWTAYGCLHINAWIWSALFHCRDTRLTERLDYTSAISLVAFGLFAASVRTLWGPGRQRRLLVIVAGGAVATGLAVHLYYMLRVKFDYGWNMRVCVAAGVATAILWLIWVAASRHPARPRMYAFLVLAHGAMLLEVLDFPPVYGLLDAHASWHIATVALTPLFYSWLLADVAAFQSKGKDI